MVNFRSILSLVALALCSPIVAEAKPKPPPKTYDCGPSGWGRVTADAVNRAYGDAPDRTTEGLSGYPHVYGNTERLAFPQQCQSVPKGTLRLELPAYANGNPYPWNERRGGDKPPPYRLVYLVSEAAKQKRFFCGLMAHIKPDPGDSKEEKERKERTFRLCTPPPAFQLGVESCQDGEQGALVEPLADPFLEVEEALEELYEWYEWYEL